MRRFSPKGSVAGKVVAVGQLAVGALALALASGCGGGDRIERDVPPSIVMIVLDTARPDLLSLYGHERPTTPFLERFAAAGTRFDRAYSSSSWTLPAHGTLFTGASPKVHRANQTFKRVADSLPLLPEELAAAGYQTAGFSANMWVSELGGLDRGFERFDNLNKDIYAPHIAALAADEEGTSEPPDRHYVAARVLEWLAEARDPRRPFFLFVNLVEPHLPYLPPWEQARHFLPSRQARWQAIQRYYPAADAREILFRHYRRREPLSAAEWRTVTHMYEGALRLADDVTREIVAAVDEVSDPENTLIFILSDHGENLGDHGEFTHIFNLYDSNLRILCVARGPGFRAGAVDDRLVQIADVHATALRVAGLEGGPEAQGRDLRGELPGDRVVTAFLEVPHISLGMFPEDLIEDGLLEPYRVEQHAAVGPRFKLIRRLDPSGRAVGEEVFDLLADAAETRPLPRSAVDAASLRPLDAALAAAGVTADGEAAGLEDLPPEVLEGLRALGYVNKK